MKLFSNRDLISSVIRTCAYQGVKFFFFCGKFAVLCFLETPVLRFPLLPYCGRYLNLLRVPRIKWATSSPGKSEKKYIYIFMFKVSKTPHQCSRIFSILMQIMYLWARLLLPKYVEKHITQLYGLYCKTVEMQKQQFKSTTCEIKATSCKLKSGLGSWVTSSNSWLQKPLNQ